MPEETAEVDLVVDRALLHLRTNASQTRSHTRTHACTIMFTCMCKASNRGQCLRTVHTMSNVNVNTWCINAGDSGVGRCLGFLSPFLVVSFLPPTSSSSSRSSSSFASSSTRNSWQARLQHSHVSAHASVCMRLSTSRLRKNKQPFITTRPNPTLAWIQCQPPTPATSRRQQLSLRPRPRPRRPHHPHPSSACWQRHHLPPSPPGAPC